MTSPVPLLGVCERADPFWKTAVALVGLVVVLCLRWPQYTVIVEWLDDEAIYMNAFHAAAAGKHPYEGGHYLYLPGLAVVGGQVAKLIGDDATVLLMRIFNLFGSATLAWLPLRFWPWTFPVRFFFAALLVQAPGVEFGLRWGNLSLIIGVTVVGGLLLAPFRPLLAGLLLGLGAAVKPVAPGALVAMVAFRTARRKDRLPYLLAGALALGILAATVLLAPYLEDFLDLRDGKTAVSENISMHRIVWLLGLQVDALTWAILVFGGIAVVGFFSRPLTRLQELAVTSAVTMLAIPLIWSHTLLITLPLQMIALRLVWQDRNVGAPGEPERRYARYRLWITVAACVSLHFTGGIAVPNFPRISLVVALVPAFSPFYLAGLVLWRTSKKDFVARDYPFGLGSDDDPGAKVLPSLR